jgi:5'-nucleotidase / UDP-sugar diphosphatase
LKRLTPLLLLAAACTAGAEIVYLNILHTNDMHGGIVSREASFMNPDFPPMIGGGAYITAYADAVREECAAAGEYCLLVDLGDIFQGTPTGNYGGGDYVVDWMNASGYDMMTLGNHDFDLGTENALDLCGQTDFPIVCANFVSTVTGEIPAPVIPYEILDIGGVDVAFIGLVTTDTYGLVTPELLGEYTFLNEVETARQYIAEVEGLGADVIVVLAHIGQPGDPERYMQRVFEAWEAGEEYTKDFSMNVAEMTCVVPGMDLVISGHTHLGLLRPWVSPVTHTIVVQGYANGTGIGRIRLALDTETGTLVGYDMPEGDEYISLLHDEYWPDEDIAEMIEGFRVVAEAGMDEVIGEALEQIPRGDSEHAVGRLVADAMMWATGADVALMNRGGIRTEIPRGAITPRVVYQAIPFEEDLFLMDVTGAELKEILETGMQGRRRDMEPGGFTCLRNQASPDGGKIENLLIGGVPMDPDSIYTLVTTGYLAQGNVGYEIMLEHDIVPAQVKLLDALVDYITAMGAIECDNMTRVIWIDEPR